MPTWQILTGEYPPAPGGVADHTRLLAAALGDARIWTTPAAGIETDDPGVRVDRDPGRWSGRGLRRLSAASDRQPAPRRLVVQYTPNAWGYKGMNLGFGRWLGRRASAGDEVWSIVHEPFYEPSAGDKPTRWLLAKAHRRMIRDVLDASSKIFAPTPTLGPRLAPFDPRGPRPIAWLPCFSNVPVADIDPVGRSQGVRIGCFGTFGPSVRSALSAILPRLLDGHPDRDAILIGRGGTSLATAIGGRVSATGELPPRGLSAAIAACDLMIQPYEDGVCCRRTTAMAPLAHGVALATNSGPNTEPLWGESGAVALADGTHPRALADVAERLILDVGERRRLGATGHALYDDRFDLRHAVAALRAAADGR